MPAPVWLVQCALARIPSGVCLLRGVSLQPEAHAGPYPRDAQHHLFLCGDEEEAHEYAKLPPHLVYRYLPRRDVLLLDLRVLAEDPAALPANQQLLAERLCGWLESSAAELDRSSRRREEGEDDACRSRRRTRDGEGGTGSAAGGGDGEDADSNGEGADSNDEALLLPRVRAFLRALRHPSVESPHTKEDAAVFAVLARCPMRAGDVQAALAGRSSRGFVDDDEPPEGSGGSASASSSSSDAAACSAEEGCSQRDATAAAASTRSSSGSQSSPFIDSPPDDAAAHVLLEDDGGADGSSSSQQRSRQRDSAEGEPAASCREQSTACADGSRWEGEPAASGSGRELGRSAAARGGADADSGHESGQQQRHARVVPWDGIVRRSRSEYLGRVVTEVLLPASAFSVSSSKREAAERVICAQQRQRQRQQQREGDDADAAAGDRAGGGRMPPASSASAAGAGAGAGAASPPQEPGEAWAFPLTPTAGRAGAQPSAADSAAAAAAGGAAAPPAATTATAPASPALSLVEIVKVPPERGAATHVKPQHVPVYGDGHEHRDDSSPAQPRAS